MDEREQEGLRMQTDLLRDKRPELVDVDVRAVELVLGLVEVSLTDLAEVARVAEEDRNIKERSEAVNTTTV